MWEMPERMVGRVTAHGPHYCGLNSVSSKGRSVLMPSSKNVMLSGNRLSRRSQGKTGSFGWVLIHHDMCLYKEEVIWHRRGGMAV